MKFARDRTTLPLYYFLMNKSYTVMFDMRDYLTFFSKSVDKMNGKVK